MVSERARHIHGPSWEWRLVDEAGREVRDAAGNAIGAGSGSLRRLRRAVEAAFANPVPEAE